MFNNWERNSTMVGTKWGQGLSPGRYQTRFQSRSLWNHQGQASGSIWKIRVESDYRGRFTRRPQNSWRQCSRIPGRPGSTTSNDEETSRCAMNVICDFITNIPIGLDIREERRVVVFRRMQGRPVRVNHKCIMVKTGEVKKRKCSPKSENLSKIGEKCRLYILRK